MIDKTPPEIIKHFVQTEKRMDQCSDSQFYRQLCRDRAKIMKAMHDWYDENFKKEGMTKG